MLFLLNDQIIDVGDPVTTIREKLDKLTPLPSSKINANVALQLGKALFFACPPNSRPSPEALQALASLIIDMTEANALLIVRPQGAQSAGEVQTRLAYVDLPVMAHLNELQKRGPLPIQLVNESVWAHAA